MEFSSWLREYRLKIVQSHDLWSCTSSWCIACLGGKKSIAATILCRLGNGKQYGTRERIRALVINCNFWEFSLSLAIINFNLSLISRGIANGSLPSTFPGVDDYTRSGSAQTASCHDTAEKGPILWDSHAGRLEKPWLIGSQLPARLYWIANLEANSSILRRTNTPQQGLDSDWLAVSHSIFRFERLAYASHDVRIIFLWNPQPVLKKHPGKGLILPELEIGSVVFANAGIPGLGAGPTGQLTSNPHNKHNYPC